MGLGSTETAAAAACTDSLRVVDVETTAHEVVDVIDIRAVDIEETRRIDNHLQTVLLYNFVIVTGIARLFTM